MITVNFVCMGNICRSPSAEAVMKKIIADANLEDQIQCDSSGTIGYHAGEPADARMRTHASKRGIDLTSVSRQVRPSDFHDFDYIVAMDDDNMTDLLRIKPSGGKASLHKMTDFCKTGNHHCVPDPYYGGADGFERVLDILEDACSGFLEFMKKEHKIKT